MIILVEAALPPTRTLPTTSWGEGGTQRGRVELSISSRLVEGRGTRQHKTLGAAPDNRTRRPAKTRIP
jgi:hypothetical protein